MKVYIVETIANDDYAYVEDSFYLQQLDSVWKSKEDAEAYIDGLSSYTVLDRTYQFAKDVDGTNSYRSVELVDWNGMGEHMYVNFVIREMEVR